ncbi:hypothetical protein GCM10010343_45200 [Streptomyces avidinii]|nr:hypothetical protein GCM10010343_45200 [Streptomyces avidinii]
MRANARRNREARAVFEHVRRHEPAKGAPEANRALKKGLRGDRRTLGCPRGGTTAVPAKDTAGSGPSASVAYARSGSRSGGTHTPFRGAGRVPVSRTSLPTTTTVPEPC